MRVILQRVSKAAVAISEEVKNKIDNGFMILVGIHDDDDEKTVDYIARKIAKMRVFTDDEGKLNLDINAVNGEILSISQFTLYARTKKGNRPSFTDAAKPEHGDRLYQLLNQKLHDDYGLTVKAGEFGADMQVSLVNDGPITIILDSDE